MEFASTVREIIAIRKQISRKARNACISSSINEQKMIVCILVVYLLGDESSEREGEFLLRAHLKEKKTRKTRRDTRKSEANFEYYWGLVYEDTIIHMNNVFCKRHDDPTAYEYMFS